MASFIKIKKHAGRGAVSSRATDLVIDPSSHIRDPETE